MNNNSKRDIRNLSLGLNIAVGFGFFIYIGYLFDQKRNDGVWGMVMGGCLGILYCFYEIWKFVYRRE